MPRKPRIELAGKYHIINRGVEQRVVFEEPADYEQFEELMCFYVKSFGITIHHYCLMSNHYHLLIEITQENLSKFMRQQILKAIDQGYSQHRIAKVLGISQPAVYGVVKRSRKWVIVITWQLNPEATKYLLKKDFIDSQYQIIVDFRNQIAHGYFDIDENIVWEVVQTLLNEFIKELVNLVKQNRLELRSAVENAKKDYHFSKETMVYLNTVK